MKTVKDVAGLLHVILTALIACYITCLQKSIQRYKHKSAIAAEKKHHCLCWRADVDVTGVVSSI